MQIGNLPASTGAKERLCAALFKPVDIFIGAHPSYYGGAEKAAALEAHPGGPNPFIDPGGYQRYIDNGEKRFRERLAKEQSR